MEVLSGEVLTDSDSVIKIAGVPCGRLGIRKRRSLGIAVVPEERLGHGAVGAMSLIENVFLSGHEQYNLTRRLWMHYSNARKFARKICDAFDVRHAGIDTDAGSLSGGNLQKYLIGREILQYPKVMIASQPTWGVDAGSQTAIHRALLNLTENGTAVLVVSQDLDELMELCGPVSYTHLTLPTKRIV